MGNMNGTTWPEGRGPTEEKARANLIEQLQRTPARVYINDYDGSVYVLNSYNEKRYMVIDEVAEGYRAWIPDLPGRGWYRMTTHIKVMRSGKRVAQ
jgi:hypothetical protein